VGSRVRDGVAPLYLFLCLILGGSAQGIWANMALRLLGLGIIAWAASARVTGRPVAAPARHVLIIAALAVALVGIQMVPLPASVWPHLGGRGPIVQGYRILGLGTPRVPISLAPYRSFDSLLGIIPPLALFVAVVSLRAYRPSWLAAALLAGTIAGVVLGALEVTGGAQGGGSNWYPYAESSYGLATGFFANANHMANLLVCTLPFIAALLASARSANRQRNIAIVVGVGAGALLIVVGIALNHSLAVYGLTPPVLAASALILLPQGSPWRRRIVLAAAVLLVGGMALLGTTSVRSSAFGSDTTTAVESRQEMLATSAEAIRDFMPWGSGLGTFRSVYQLYENPTQVTNTYVIHAHDDYVELALETGLPGVLLMIGFLVWWVGTVWRAWRYTESGVWSRAASIASGAILLHSLVDFPLRTAAISAVFAMCLALLVERRSIAIRSKSDLRPTRHVVLR
jgi:O-antigen ligase